MMHFCLDSEEGKSSGYKASAVLSMALIAM